MTKTVADLKQLVLANEGSINMGKLTIEYKEGQDIDIKLNREILAWIPSGREDTDLLESEETVRYSGILEQLRTENENFVKTKIEMDSLVKDKEEIISKKEVEIQNLKESIKENDRVFGKVEAYEKLLLGRTVNISA